MAFKFPWSNLHELNLDWILSVVKRFSELVPPMETAVEDVQALQSDVEQAVTDAQAAVTAANHAAETAAEALEVAEQAAAGTIADDAVTTAKLADSAVTNDKIAAGAVTASKLGPGAVTTLSIANGAITTDKIENGTIIAEDMADGAVTTPKLADDAVTNAKLADNAVNTAEIAAGAVTNTKIADQSINKSKLMESLIPTISTQTTTIDINDIVLRSFTQFYESEILDTGFMHLFIVIGSCTAPTGNRFLLNMSPGGQLEFVNSNSSSGYSILGAAASEGDGVNREIIYYWAGITPTSNISVEITHIKIPI